jgi:hypothetical protein
MKKEKETKNQKKTIQPEKTKKEKNAKKKPPRRVNGPAQRRAHAGGAEFRSANGRSIGFPLANFLVRPRDARPSEPGKRPAQPAHVRHQVYDTRGGGQRGWPAQPVRLPFFSFFFVFFFLQFVQMELLNRSISKTLHGLHLALIYF